MKNNDRKNAIVIGGGIGGLCTAARLLKNGYKVTVLEKEDKVGGRANRIEKEGYTFDMGPTLLMMTDVLYETFSYCGKNFDDYITLLQLEPNYRVAFADKSKITVSSNLPRFAKELSSIDPKGPEQFYKFFGDVSAMYRISRNNFIDKNFKHVTDFINPISGAQLLKRRGLSKLYNFVAHYFDDERLQQLFSFQSMYLGVSPHEAPAVYSMVSYMETGLGIWYPKGGMYSLSLAIQKLVKDLGGEIITSTPVEEIIIEDKTAVGVKITKKSELRADLIITNADLVYAQMNLIDESLRPSAKDIKLLSYKQASSALLFYWGVDDPCEQMLHHNVYLCKDFKGNLDEIFHLKKLPKDPSFYTYIPTKTDPSLAPKGKSVFYVLVPVPNLDSNVNWDIGIKRIKRQVISRLKTEFGLDITKKIRVESVFTPEDFKAKYNLHVGSAFGLSHHFFQSGYFRPNNKSKDIKNLYFVGASTYPGGGIPMVTLSAKLVTERILDDAK